MVSKNLQFEKQSKFQSDLDEDKTFALVGVGKDVVSNPSRTQAEFFVLFIFPV